ncbi:MAG: class I SAM-dependent methyltransferase [Alphaproteobacteria bacterium]
MAGKDVGNLRPEDLGPLDHFRGRGVAARAERVTTLELSKGDEVLDIGGGVGGPARFVARTYDRQVVGIDLTAEYCAVAERPTQAVGLSGQVRFEQASATNLPFDDGRFQAAYSKNVP